MADRDPQLVTLQLVTFRCAGGVVVGPEAGLDADLDDLDDRRLARMCAMSEVLGGLVEVCGDEPLPLGEHVTAEAVRDLRSLMFAPAPGAMAGAMGMGNDRMHMHRMHMHRMHAAMQLADRLCLDDRAWASLASELVRLLRVSEHEHVDATQVGLRLPLVQGCASGAGLRETVKRAHVLGPPRHPILNRAGHP